MTLTPNSVAQAADTLDLRTASAAHIKALLIELVRIDQRTYFGEPEYGTTEHRAMIVNRRRLERLRCALAKPASSRWAQTMVA